jgi:hypothetical protein
MGARVGLDGSRPDGVGVTISTGVVASSDEPLDPVVALGKNGVVLVAWQNRGTDEDIYAARVNAAGQVLDPVPIPISEVGGTSEGEPAIAFNGQAFLVVYRSGSTTLGARVVGTTVQSIGLVADFEQPVVAASGSTFLVVGVRGGDGISGRRVAGSGSFLGTAFRITNDRVVGRQAQPTVAGGPSQWVTAWTDERKDPDAAGGDIYGARIASDGTVQEINGFLVDAVSGRQDMPCIVMQGDAALVAWRDRGTGEDIVVAAHLSAAGVVKETDGVPISAGTPGSLMQGPASG